MTDTPAIINIIQSNAIPAEAVFWSYLFIDDEGDICEPRVVYMTAEAAYRALIRERNEYVTECQADDPDLDVTEQLGEWRLYGSGDTAEVWDEFQQGHHRIFPLRVETSND